ncbi:hypothetical protein RM530_18390 [Algiphilus sp. W345]|uniref:Uncharacterized protein n=1 Tax=Banduia mediterranea TaxID=3075609 RepID=A0ABU2WN62_9GAMM|nr:hypothetical protein [Algiphilus sp. W345]MDT0499313.1 hypothetical protein [Algiphilus sp. W345]
MSDKLLERIVEVESSTVLAALERKVTKLEHDKVALHEKIMQVGKPLRPFNEALQTALALLASPWKLWESGALAEQRTLMKLAFTERLRYLRGEGFQTTSTALPFKALACLTTGQMDIAEREGLVGLRPHPFGTARRAFDSQARIVEPGFVYRGFESPFALDH